MKFFHRLPLFFLTCFLWWCVPSLRADTDTVQRAVLRIAADSLANNRVVGTETWWKFRTGDNLAYTLPTLNDSNWRVLPTMLALDTLADDFWSGLGWFRLVLEVDSSLYNTTVAVVMNHFGASELYCDGRLVNRFGIVSADATLEKAFHTQARPVPLFLDSSPCHVLALRYSDARLRTLNNRYGQGLKGTLGFSFAMGESASRLQRYAADRTVTIIFAMVPIGILILLALLHYAMYVYVQSNKTNLYLAVFSVMLAGVCFSYYARLYLHTTRERLVWNEIAFVVALAMVILSLSAALYTIVYEQPLRHRLWFVVPSAVGLVIGRFILPISSWNVLLLVVVTVQFAEFCRIVIVAIRRKRDGAVIIGVGVSMFLVTSVSLIISTLAGWKLALGWQAFTQYGTFLSMPVAMALYVARHFANMNQKIGEQLLNVQELSRQAIDQEREKQRLIERQKEELESVVAERTKELETKNGQLHDANEEIQRQLEVLNEQSQQIMFTNMELLKKNVGIASEREKSEDLLLNVLPPRIAERLKAGEQTIADKLPNVTVLFADIAGFTRLSARIKPEALVSLLDSVFSEFDQLVERFGVEKIKTIGDAYMVVGGLPSAHCSSPTPHRRASGTTVHEDAAAAVALLALEMHEALRHLAETMGIIGLSVRIGMHTGEAIAGVIGTKKFNYDLWGDTVNTASRMESHGEAGKIHCTAEVHEKLCKDFEFEDCGITHIKGKGMMQTYFLVGKHTTGQEAIV